MVGERAVGMHCKALRCGPRGANSINKKLAGRWFDGEACNVQKYGTTIS
jgi:hypothetical protein